MNLIVKTLLGFFFLILGLVQLIKWIVQSAQQKDRDWLSNAQQRQINQYDYTDPQWEKSEKKSLNGKWTTDGWYYDPKKNRWIGPDYEPNWVYNESAGMWVDADQLNSEKTEASYQATRNKWQQLQEEQIALRDAKPHIELTQEETEIANVIRVQRQEPTYEEWKAAKLKEVQEAKAKKEIASDEQQADVQQNDATIISTTSGTTDIPKKQKVKYEVKKVRGAEKRSEFQDVYQAVPILTQNEMHN